MSVKKTKKAVILIFLGCRSTAVLPYSQEAGKYPRGLRCSTQRLLVCEKKSGQDMLDNAGNLELSQVS